MRLHCFALRKWEGFRRLQSLQCGADGRMPNIHDSILWVGVLLWLLSSDCCILFSPLARLCVHACIALICQSSKYLPAERCMGQPSMRCVICSSASGYESSWALFA